MREINPRELNPLIEECAVDTIGLCTEQIDNFANAHLASEQDPYVRMYFELMWIKGALKYAAEQVLQEQAKARS